TMGNWGLGASGLGVPWSVVLPSFVTAPAYVGSQGWCHAARCVTVGAGGTRMPIRSTAARHPLRVLVLAVTSVALTWGAAPADAARKSPTQVRKWSTAAQTVTPGTTVKATVKVISRGRPSKRRVVI